MKALILSISLLITVASVQPASAQWKLNENNSHLSFVSIKNNAVAEVNRFESLIIKRCCDSGRGGDGQHCPGQYRNQYSHTQ